MNCRDTVRLLNGHVDAELDLTSSLAIEEHLLGCPRCRVFESNLRSLRSAVRRHTEFHAAPDSLRGCLEMRYARERAGAFTRFQRRLAFATAAVAVAVLTGWLGLLTMGEAPRAAADVHAKAVYHIANSDYAGAALRNLANHLEASPEVKVVVVAHNNGVDFLLRGARDDSGQLYEAAVGQFRERGVEFRVCNNTLARRSIDSSQLIPGAILVPSGIAEISRLQSQEGYAYMKL